MKNSSHPDFLDQEEIENLLQRMPSFQNFWNQKSAMLIFRSIPQPFDPVYEIQLVLNMEARIETWAWLWIDAYGGKIIKTIPD